MDHAKPDALSEVPARRRGGLRESESFLWPDALPPERAAAVTESEVVKIYPRRSVVPAELWDRLLREATDQIGILAYGGLFLHELNPEFVTTLRVKADTGTRVEVAVGDPDSGEVAQRGADEASVRRWPGKFTTFLPSTRIFVEPITRRFTFTARRSTTRSTGSMTRCWSTPIFMESPQLTPP